MSKKYITCPQCEEPVEISYKFCPHCGTAWEIVKKEKEKKKKKDNDEECLTVLGDRTWIYIGRLGK